MKMKVIKTISLCIIILLVLPYNLSGQATTSPPISPQEKSFTLSGEALAAAERLRSKPNERTLADLDIVINELLRVGQAASADRKPESQAITKQQLIDLLGPPTSEDEKGDVTYANNYGTTTMFFENGLLKETLSLGEATYWYSYPRQSAAKRLWYKIVRWSGKLKRLLF